MAKATGIYPDELHVSGLIREQSLSARLGGDAHLSATLSGRIVLNDYVLTLLDAGSVKRIIAERSGEEPQVIELSDGVGIASAVLNDDYTLTLSFSDGTSYTTPSIRGAKGETPEVTARRTENGLELYSDGTLIGYLNDGPKGDTPVITGMRQGGVTVLFADGAEIARIADGHSPVITASKADGITHIYADSVEIAAIADGRDIDPDAIKRYVDGEVAKKQDTIEDLTAIRRGAEKGATALQSVTADDVESALGYKPADPKDVPPAYDDTAIRKSINDINARLDTLLPVEGVEF